MKRWLLNPPVKTDFCVGFPFRFPVGTDILRQHGPVLYTDEVLERYFDVPATRGDDGDIVSGGVDALRA